MMKQVTATVLCAASSLLLSSNAIAAARSVDLNRAVHEYDKAQVTGDRKLLTALLADDYVLLNSGGETETKSQFISDLTDPSYHLNPYIVNKPIIRRWVGGAVFGGVSHLTGTVSTKPFDVCLRFADIWALRRGHWQVIYTQAARAKPEECR